MLRGHPVASVPHHATVKLVHSAVAGTAGMTAECGMGCTCLQRRQRYSGVIEALGFSQSEARTLYGYFAQADVQCRGDITLHELWKFLGVDRTGFTERVRRNAVLCRWQRTGAWLEHVPSTSIREAVTCITLTVRALTGVQLVRWRWQWHRGLWRVPGVAVQLLCVERGPRRVPRRVPGVGCCAPRRGAQIPLVGHSPARALPVCHAGVSAQARTPRCH